MVFLWFSHSKCLSLSPRIALVCVASGLIPNKMPPPHLVHHVVSFPQKQDGKTRKKSWKNENRFMGMLRFNKKNKLHSWILDKKTIDTEWECLSLGRRSNIPNWMLLHGKPRCRKVFLGYIDVHIDL